MNEADVANALLGEPEVALGLAAPYESSPQLVYSELFAMDWSLIVPPGHALTAKRRVKLSQTGDEPLILYERGSTGRQHVLDAFTSAGCLREWRWKPQARRLSSAWWKRGWGLGRPADVHGRRHTWTPR